MLPMSQFRLLGRYAMIRDELWLASSLCEVGFLLRGATTLTLRLRADGSVSDPERQHRTPRYALRVGGRLFRDARMAQPEEVLSVPAAWLEGEAEIRLIKLSECTQSLLALTEVRTDGFLFPLPARPRRIRFIGDSITCGYGVEAPDGSSSFSTATENAEKSYAALVADALDMDPELIAFSGHGIVSGFTDDPARRNLRELVPPYYDRVGRGDDPLPDGRYPQDIPWDMDSHSPDQIILNLGTNDLSWCREDPDRIALFEREYAAFLKVIRQHSPGTPVLCVLGIMGTGLNEAVARAVEAYRAATGDALIRTLLLPEQDQERDGCGADFHPSEITQRRLAQRILDVLSAAP